LRVFRTSIETIERKAKRLGIKLKAKARAEGEEQMKEAAQLAASFIVSWTHPNAYGACQIPLVIIDPVNAARL